MESGTIAPGASEEQQEEMRRRAAEADANPPAEPLEGEEPGEQEPEPLELVIEGEGQLTLTVGGKKPESSTIRLIGGKMDIAEGDFDKGAHINLLLGCVVTSVEFVDTYDQYGNVSGSERRHKVRPLRVERVRD